MLSLHAYSNSKLTIIFLFMGMLSFGSIATAKPSWKDDNSTEQSTKGSGKGGGKNKTTTPISEITIVEHPVSITIMNGEKATFAVSASSSDGQEIIYQWYLNSSIINNANAASFSIESSSLSDQGEYSVSLRTPDATKTTQASLSIEATPDPVIAIEISLHPVSQTAYIQENFTLNVSAIGSGTLSYQWRKNGVSLSGQIQSYLNFESLNLNDSAQYDVVISNEAGSVTSNIATLTVNPLSTIALAWDTPTARDDGSALELNDIDSYNIYISYDGDTFEDTIKIPATLNNIEFSDMPPGNYQLAIATTDTTGATGSRSETLMLIIN